MENNIAIKCINVSKKYVIKTAGINVGYSSLREALTSFLTEKLTLKKAQSPQSKNVEFWALKNVSLEISRGDRVAIIGRNGAGKSTLLKILSRITEPTSGSLELVGRVTTLLEVGTGFHPELTGRENIFLNGAILGMGKSEIKSKFDQIVDFAEVSNFLDTPVKRYSSGMYARLAFSVAAHLEPEILIVDEVLAVGDAQFQKKCLGKMSEMGDSGRTILFVSHNLGAVRQLCTKGIVLEAGEVLFAGSANDAADFYLTKTTASLVEYEGVRLFDADNQDAFVVESIKLMDVDGNVKSAFECDEDVIIEVDCTFLNSVHGLYGYLAISNREGSVIFVSDSYDSPPNQLDGVVEGSYTCKMCIPARSLSHGQYFVSLSFSSSQSDSGFYLSQLDRVISFTLSDSSTIRGNDRLGYFSSIVKWDLCARI